MADDTARCVKAMSRRHSRLSTRPLKPAPVIPATAEHYIHLPRDADGFGRGPARCLVSASSRAIDEKVVVPGVLDRNRA
jgi:hypothetical protein